MTDEVAISATRTETPLRQSAPAVTVLMRKEIERSPYANGHQMDDLLRTVPGIHLHALQPVLNGENLTDRHYIATQTGPIKTLGSLLLIIGGSRAEF